MVFTRGPPVEYAEDMSHRSPSPLWLVVVLVSFGCAPAAAPGAASPSTAASSAAPPAAHSAELAREHPPGGHDAHGHPRHHGLHKDFSDAEAFSARFDDPARDAWQRPDQVLDLMQIIRGSTVVDLGAGTGYFAAPLARRVGAAGKVLALDVEPKMVEFMQRRIQQENLPNVEPRVVPADDPALLPGSASRVLIVNTWHHLDDRSSYARKLATALDATGEIWIVDFTLDADRGPPPEHRLSALQVIRELEQGGLRAQLIEPDPLPEQYIVRAMR